MEYTLDGVDFRQEEERQSENNFLSPQFSLKYTNQLPGKYVFQARFFPSYDKHSQQTDSRLAFIQDGIGSDRYGVEGKRVPLIQSDARPVLLEAIPQPA